MALAAPLFGHHADRYACSAWAPHPSTRRRCLAGGCPARAVRHRHHAHLQSARAAPATRGGLEKSAFRHPLAFFAECDTPLATAPENRGGAGERSITASFRWAPVAFGSWHPQPGTAIRTREPDACASDRHDAVAVALHRELEGAPLWYAALPATADDCAARPRPEYPLVGRFGCRPPCSTRRSGKMNLEQLPSAGWRPPPRATARCYGNRMREAQLVTGAAVAVAAHRR